MTKACRGAEYRDEMTVLVAVGACSTDYRYRPTSLSRADFGASTRYARMLEARAHVEMGTRANGCAGRSRGASFVLVGAVLAGMGLAARRLRAGRPPALVRVVEAVALELDAARGEHLLGLLAAPSSHARPRTCCRTTCSGNRSAPSLDRSHTNREGPRKWKPPLFSDGKGTRKAGCLPRITGFTQSDPSREAVARCAPRLPPHLPRRLSRSSCPLRCPGRSCGHRRLIRARPAASS